MEIKKTFGLQRYLESKKKINRDANELDIGVRRKEVVRLLLGYLTLCNWKVSFTKTWNTERSSVWELMGR